MNTKLLTKNSYAKTFLFDDKKTQYSEQTDHQLFYKIKTENAVEVKENSSAQKQFIVTRKAKLYKKQSFCVKEQLKYQQNKLSNFQRLKTQIKQLENSQFLSLKTPSKLDEQFDKKPESFYKVNTDFMSTKKVSTLEKYKLNLKKKGKQRRVSLLLDFNKKQNLSIEDFCFKSLRIKDSNNENLNKIDLNLKRKQTPNIVKKYYRPQSCNYKSMQKISVNENEVRGRKLRSSGTDRKQKQNVLIICC